MIRVDRPVIVEGKYDKIRLSGIIEGMIIDIGGFGIYRNRELQNGLRRIGREKGLIIMTDSDSSGFKIRNFLKGILGQDVSLTHVYIPEIKGRERRKTKPSSEGLLGVEGLTEEIIIKAFSSAHVCTDNDFLNNNPVTRYDLYEVGFIGKSNSSRRRKEYLLSHSLPSHLSTDGMLDAINLLYTRDEFLEQINEGK